jgi:hypothetical protein
MRSVCAIKHDRPQDRDRLLRFGALDERAVDLQRVDRERLQRGKARVPGPEIVDRERDAVDA